jgi:leader peptidase (prepilin peptidase) / N-methyltransferase
MTVMRLRTAVLPAGERAALVTAACMAAIVGFAVYRAENPLHFAMLASAALLLVALAACDLTTMLLPNRLTYPGLAAAVLLAGGWPDHSWISSLAGGAAGGAIMLALFVIVPGFGAGDVKLCALIGLLVGWPHVLGALAAGVVCNGLVALALVAAGRAGRRTTMPYGPGLVAGALIALLL